jgi:hypothetical protein
MSSKSPSSKQAIRLTDLHVGMFVEVNSGDPKNPWWGEIHQIHSKKKTVVKKSKEEEDEDFEPIGVKWIARVLGTKEKLYEYKGGSHRIWKESIVKCGHDLDCGLYLKGKGRKVLSKAPKSEKSIENTKNTSTNKNNTKNSMALVVRKSTPTKKKTDKGRALHLVKEKRQTELNKRLARESERLKKEKAKWAKAAREANLKAREANRKVASIEKDQIRVASGKMPSGKKMPSTPIKQRTKSAPVSKKSPGGAVFQRVLTKGLGVAKKMMIPSPKKQQAYHKQVAKLTQPPLQKKLKTSSKSVKCAPSLPQPTKPWAKAARKSAPGVVFGSLSATDSDDDSDEF